MSYQVEAVFEDGVLKLLKPLDLPEHQILNLVVYVPSAVDVEQELDAWHEIYSGLSVQELDELERIASERNNFMRQVN